MGKVMPIALLMVMATLLFISWGNIAKYHSNMKTKFDNHMKAAQQYEEKQIYIDAVAEYKMALNLDPDNYDLAVKIKDMYAMLNLHEDYLAACEKAKSIDPTRPEMHKLLINYYWELAEYDTAYAYLKDARKYLPEDEEILTKIKTLRGMYDLKPAVFQDFMGWCCNESGEMSAVVMMDDKYGLINGDAATVLTCSYEGSGPIMSGVFSVKVGEDCYFADMSGNRKIVPDTPVEFLGGMNNGFALAKRDGIYGYINNKGADVVFQFEDAGSFSNNVAPVKIDGNWYLIDTSFNIVSGLTFEDILMDEYGFCSVYGVFFGKVNGRYHLYDTKGNLLSTSCPDGFEDAKLFASDQPAAVKMDGKWGFLNKDGSIAMQGTFEDADSFNFGCAPFKEGDKWGCYSIQGERLIEPTFDDMKAFARNGKALVEINGISQFLTLKYYN